MCSPTQPISAAWWNAWWPQQAPPASPHSRSACCATPGPDKASGRADISSPIRVAQREELPALGTKDSLLEYQPRPARRQDGTRRDLDLTPGIDLVGILGGPRDRVSLGRTEGDARHLGPDRRRRTHRTRFERRDEERAGQVA